MFLAAAALNHRRQSPSDEMETQPRQKTNPSTMVIKFAVVALVSLLSIFHILHTYNNDLPWFSRSTQRVPKTREKQETNSSCAIMFFGLPRSFKRYVLPSVIRNVVLPNMKHGCDFFVHYYQIDKEEAGRSGHGGEINADDVLLLENAIQAIYNDTTMNLRKDTPADIVNKPPSISFISDTNDTFWDVRGEQVLKYRNTRRNNGHYLYYPQKVTTYVYPSTMDNIVKQWHSINAVWERMESISKEQEKTYDRVAMLRSDVIFLHPIDIYVTHNLTRDVNNEYLTIPDWAGWPVNDRMVSGPYEAVKVWATERFERLTKYVRTNPVARAGYGMHPERFLKNSLLPHIQENLGYKLDMNKRFCFVRVRADGGVWIDDCVRGFRHSNATDFFRKDILPEDASCKRIALRKNKDQMYCNFTDRSDDLLWNLRERPIR